MKKILSLLLLSAGLAGAQTPFEYRGVDFTGTPLTNAITIEPWPNTNAIIGYDTNIVAGLARTYTPNTNGYVSGTLMPNNYRMTVAGFARGISFGIIDSTNTQNLAAVANIPTTLLYNWTVAQLSDAGTAAYSNTAAFFLASSAGTAAYSNAAAFITTAQIGTAAYSNTAAFALSGITTNIWVSDGTNAFTLNFTNGSLQGIGP
jgi:hypothetical protein